MISIIIPTCKEANLIPCLESIRKYTEGVEIIVVPNGYDNGDIKADKVCWHTAKIGYPRACNAGIKEAEGDFIVLLNDDTQLLPQEKNAWLNMLQAPFEDEHVGITGPWMMHNTEIRKDFLCFFCCMIRKSMLDKIGVLDEAFGFGYAEDVDLCCRAVASGYRIVQVPNDGKVPYDGRYGIGAFPIYHEGNVTFRNWPDGDKLMAKNHGILRERYRVVNIENAKKLGEWVSDDELTWLATQAQKVKVVIELGSWFGKSSTAIADNLPEDGVLYCVDTWAGSEAEKDTNHAQARELDGDYAYDQFCKNLWPHIQSGKLKTIRMHGRHAAKLLQAQGVKADLIFIDAGHLYHEVQEDIWSFAPLMKPGGIMSGHDYGRPQWPPVTEAVNDIFKGNVACNPNTTIWSTDCNPLSLRPKIYDCFPFFNELELLEIRLNELYDTVDHFVIVEATRTHQGSSKPLFFYQNAERFKKFMDKIIYVQDDFAGVQDDTWARERHQRSMIMEGLKDAKDNDIIIITDADEIPNAEAIKTYRTEMGVACLNMKLYYYYLNSEGIDSVWAESKIAPYWMVRERTPEGIRYIQNDPDRAWVIAGNVGEPIPDGGWHFSYCGGADRVKEKIRSFGHAEYNRPDVLEAVETRMAAGKDIFDREMYYRIIEPNGDLPAYVQQNVERFREAGFIK